MGAAKAKQKNQAGWYGTDLPWPHPYPRQGEHAAQIAASQASLSARLSPPGMQLLQGLHHPPCRRISAQLAGSIQVRHRCLAVQWQAQLQSVLHQPAALTAAHPHATSYDKICSHSPSKIILLYKMNSSLAPPARRTAHATAGVELAGHLRRRRCCHRRLCQDLEALAPSGGLQPPFPILPVARPSGSSPYQDS